jgi:hypothetical protein
MMPKIRLLELESLGELLSALMTPGCLGVSVCACRLPELHSQNKGAEKMIALVQTRETRDCRIVPDMPV